MKNTKFLLLAAVCVLLSAACGREPSAVVVPETEPAFRHMGTTAPYTPGDMRDTPAPKGYEPFYISHYGRHGSRFQRNDDKLNHIIETLGRERRRGNLTATGEALLDSVISKHSFIEGKLAQLAPRGGIEHRAIASRMSLRFAPVWKDGGRVDATASSEGGRCIVSMCYFTNELQSRHPSLDMKFTGGVDMYRLLSGKGFPKELPGMVSRYIESSGWYLSEGEAADAVARLFVRPSLTATERRNLLDAIFEEWKYSGCMDRNFIDIKSVFPSGEECKYGDYSWDSFYTENGNSLNFGKKRIQAQIPCLMRIIADADDVLSGKQKKVADLRFGHDSGLMALLSLMRMPPYDAILDFKEAHTDWLDRERMPMASNLQIVFYRKKSCDRILVKVLYNEQERYFPFAESVSGPYYDWETLRTGWLEYASVCAASVDAS